MMAFLLWDFTENWVQQLMLISFVFFGILLFIKGVKIYVKIEHSGKRLLIKSFFSSTTYNLDELTSWNEMTNIYRVSYRKLKLEFGNNKVELMDHSDRQNIEELYHYLRTHYSEIGN